MQVGASWLCMVAIVVGCGDSATSPDAALPDAPPDAIGYTILEAYGHAWEEPDAVVRGRLLAYSTVEAIELFEPTRTVVSRAAVDAAMAMFLADYPGGTIPLVGNIRERHDRVWLRWDAYDANHTKLSTGLDLMKRAGDGRIERVHSFFGTLPLAVGTSTPVQQAMLDAWNEPDPTARLALLDTAVTDDVVMSLHGAGAPVVGRAAVSAAIGDALAAAPGRQTARTSGYLLLPTAWHVAWRALAADNTTILDAGVAFALTATDGRVSELVFFDGVQP